jgi:hypothetical protein
MLHQTEGVALMIGLGAGLSSWNNSGCFPDDTLRLWFSHCSLTVKVIFSPLSRGFLAASASIFSEFVRSSIIHFLTVNSLLTDIFSCFALASVDGSIAPYAKLSRLPHEYRLHEYEKSFSPRVCYLIAKNVISPLLGMYKKMYMRFSLIEVNGPKIEAVGSEVGLLIFEETSFRGSVQFWAYSHYLRAVGQAPAVTAGIGEGPGGCPLVFIKKRTGAPPASEVVASSG